MVKFCREYVENDADGECLTRVLYERVAEVL